MRTTERNGLYAPGRAPSRARGFGPFLAALWALAAAPGCNLLNGLDDVTYETGGGGAGADGGGGQGATGGGGSGATGGTTSTGGSGGCTPVSDDNECTEDICEDDSPVSNPLAAGTTCSAGVCDGAGVCIGCIEDDDCTMPMVCIDDTCVDVDCGDGLKNGVETDVDCGGDSGCPPCDDDLGCDIAADCVSGVCESMKCQPAACDDTVKNGDETAVDCGGACAPAKTCADGDGCESAVDCTSGVCTEMACAAPVCGDGVQNQPTEACDDGNMVDGDGCDNGCIFNECGDGIPGAFEDCDDGNATNGDGCDEGPGGNCTVSACGNGVVAGTEVCDDGNQANGDGCDDGMGGTCTPTACGNGVVTGTEVCDDGNGTSGDGCDTNCTVTACGNGVVTGTEACDDGNGVIGDGCDDGPTGNCSVTACGNGVVSPGEACDDGNNTNGDACDDGPGGNCVFDGGGCGNGVVTGAEACDDGNLTNGDGCDANCTPTGCGNGIVSGIEQCDDGNLVNGDGCDSNCTPTGCGNGVLTGAEVCDDGNTTGADGCSATCTPENIESEPNNTCGAEDGPFLVSGSVNVIAAITPIGDLDFFSFTLPGPGPSSIKIETFSGVVPGACAVGNDTLLELRAPNCTTVLASDDDDGINACSLIDAAGADTGARKLPAGTYFVRVSEFNNDLAIANYNVSVTVLSTCGNGGALQPTEACDDGNLVSGDGCDANCTVSACGNGLAAGAEGCDDGNTTNGDGCSSTCAVEAGYNCTGTPSVCTGICGDGVVQINEGCEDGNLANGDCCSSTCGIQSCEVEMNGACGMQTPMPPFALTPRVAYASGAITPLADLDFYTFVLAKPATVRVETFGPTLTTCAGDTLLELRGPDCTSVIVSDDDDGVGVCSLINPTTDAAARNLPAGTYTVQVREFGDDLTIASYGVKVTLVDECGNGTKGAFEGCDDTNNTDGDGCSATCVVEAGFTCTGTTPSVCSPI